MKHITYTTILAGLVLLGFSLKAQLTDVGGYGSDRADPYWYNSNNYGVDVSGSLAGTDSFLNFESAVDWASMMAFANGCKWGAIDGPTGERDSG
jgi:hypothetical protein